MGRNVDNNIRWLERYNLEIRVMVLEVLSDGRLHYQVLKDNRVIYSWWSTSTNINWYHRRAIRKRLEAIENEN